MRALMEMRVLMGEDGDEGLDGDEDPDGGIKKFLRLYIIVLVVAHG